MPTIRPIIFSTDMVRALLEGRKTQTRRLASSPLAKCQPGDVLYVRESIHKNREPISYRADMPLGSNPEGPWTPSIHMPRKCSRLSLSLESVRFQPLQKISDDDALAEGSFLGRCPCAAMQAPAKTIFEVAFKQTGCHIHGSEFRSLWNRLHKKEGERWEDNPDLVALSFRVIKANVDLVKWT